MVAILERQEQAMTAPAPGQYAAVDVEGDGLEPFASNGTVAIFRTTSQPRDGEVVVAYLAGRAAIGQYDGRDGCPGVQTRTGWHPLAASDTILAALVAVDRP